MIHTHSGVSFSERISTAVKFSSRIIKMKNGTDGDRNAHQRWRANPSTIASGRT